MIRVSSRRLLRSFENGLNKHEFTKAISPSTGPKVRKMIAQGKRDEGRAALG